MKYFIVLLSIFLLFSTINGIKVDIISSNQPDECNFCEFIVEYIEDFVEKNQTETEIKNEIEKACHFIPNDLQNTCKVVISEYLGEIINMLINDQSPRSVCNNFKFCIPPSSESKSESDEYYNNNNNNNILITTDSKLECSYCQNIISIIENFIESNSTQDEIINSLDSYCNLLDGNIAITCQAIVNQYIPLAINLLENDEDPITVCNQIKLCTSTNSLNSSTSSENHN